MQIAQHTHRHTHTQTGTHISMKLLILIAGKSRKNRQMKCHLFLCLCRPALDIVLGVLMTHTHTHPLPHTPTHMCRQPTFAYCCPCLASFAIASLTQSERHLPCNYNSVQLGNLSVRLKAAIADAADVAAAFATQQKKKKGTKLWKIKNQPQPIRGNQSAETTSK